MIFRKSVPPQKLTPPDFNEATLLARALEIASGADLARYEAVVYKKALTDIIASIRDSSEYLPGSPDALARLTWEAEKLTYKQIADKALTDVENEHKYHQENY